MAVLGKPVETWIEEYPLLQDMIALKECLWINNHYSSLAQAKKMLPLGEVDILDAEARLLRFAPYIAKVFPETRAQKGLLESPIIAIGKMKVVLEEKCGQSLPGNLLLKCDSHLPVSGSIKARGGIYEVLKHAETLALAAGLLAIDDNYECLDSEEARAFFSRYSVSVGSTGNLGLSIGIMSAKLGFKVTVHMSADARQWKKDLLRCKGVTVVEYDSDYSKAVEEGRRQSDLDPNGYFVDDENSQNLFLGYAVAAKRLEKQLQQMGISVDEDHPLFVYLPCGVGGGPGGVAFGLKLLYGDHVHCFFAEPTHSPCMMIGCMTGKHNAVCVQDFGIDNKTGADGLAVGRASGFVGKTMEHLLSGCYSVSDEHLYQLLTELTDAEQVALEPSALAGMPGIVRVCATEAGNRYVETQQLQEKMQDATHIVWATGGSMVPPEIMQSYYDKGAALLR